MRVAPLSILLALAWTNTPGCVAAVARFEPLACNAGGYGACLPVSAADPFAVNDGEGVVTIPCGSCVTLDDDGAHYEWEGIDVRGKLVVPEGVDVFIVTKFILVQGELEIQSSQTPITNEPRVTITLTGTDESQTIEHLIHPQNRDTCASASCVVGKKAIVAAGGVLNVRGMPPDCPAWVHLEDVLSENDGEAPAQDCRSFLSSQESLSSNRAHDGIYLVVDTDPVDGTVFQSMRGRKDKYAFVTFDFDPACVPQSTSVVYAFRSKVRVHAPDDAPTSVSWRMYWKSPTGGWGGVATVLDCPKLTRSDGWATCMTSFSFGENMIGQGPMRMEGMSDRGEFFPDIDFSEVSFAYSHARIDSLIVDRSHANGDVSDCWGIGSEIMLPSNTMQWDGDEIRTIESISVSEGGDRAILGLSSPLAYKPTTSLEDPETAAEVALLSRNIVWKADSDDADPFHGGHVKILNTPDRAQHISGVAVLGFGQQGKLGFYPVHFHFSDNVHGSVLSKNVVRGSHQRCVVIHGSHGVEIHQNVAYDNFGHCLMVGEDGIESDNIVHHNLIAKTKNIASSKMVRAGETDFHASSIWISNPQNDFVGNVCAGSESNGFWLEFQPTAKEPSRSAFGSSVNPQQLGLGTFYGNVAHSIAGPGFRTYPNGYHPQVSAVFENTLAYRNTGDGFFAHNSNNIILKGGLFSDNRISIDFDKADAMIVDGARLTGFSDLYKKLASESGAPTHCSKYTAQKELVGIQSHLWMVDANQPFGAKIKDVRFSDFANQGCKGFIMNWSHDSRGYFDYTTTFSGTIHNGTPLIDMCLAASKGINEVVVTDLDGTLDPNGYDNQSVSSLISHDATIMIEDGKCTPIPKICAQYCRETCLRSFVIAMDNAGTQDLQLEISNGERTVLVGSTFDSGNEEENTWYMRYRYFSASLPSGDYTARFVLADGTTPVEKWPKLVELTEERPPGCDSYYQSLALEPPPPTFESCKELIDNGDVEDGLDPWHHSGGGIKLVNSGVGDSVAISSVSRSGYWDSLGQFISMPCISFMKGKSYEIRAKVRMFEQHNGAAWPCDADVTRTQWESCPRVTFKLYSPSNTQFVYLAHAVRSAGDPMNLSGYNFIGTESNRWIELFGVFTVTDKMASAQHIFAYVERVKSGIGMVVDDVSIKAVLSPEEDELSCDNLVRNGDFEIGTSQWWDLYNGGKIGIVTEESGNHMLRSYKRGTKAHGPRQDLVHSCMKSGKTYRIYAEVKLTDSNGNSHTCDPTISWGNECPKARIKIQKGGESDQYVDIGFADNWEDGWNVVSGEFQFTPEMIDADLTALVFEKADRNFDVTIDNVSIILLDKLDQERYLRRSQK